MKEFQEVTGNDRENRLFSEYTYARVVQNIKTETNFSPMFQKKIILPIVINAFGQGV